MKQHKKHPNEFRAPRLAIPRQFELMKNVWHANEPGYKHLFGVEWILVLFLVTIQFIFPTLYIRHFLGKTLHSRKLWIETWAISKPVILLVLLNVQGFPILRQILATYFLLDLYAYLFGLVFLSDFYSGNISKKRNMFLLLINFCESCFGFALIYLCQKSLMSNGAVLSEIVDHLYFSFITAATVGYGDIISTSKLVVITQVVSSFVFVSVILSVIIGGKDQSKLQTDSPD
ncbi:MAG: ion channel [Bacteriovoracia bacterium]